MLRKKRRNYQPLLVFLLVTAIAAIGWFVFSEWRHRRTESVQSQETTTLRQKTDTLTQQVADLETELKTVQGDIAAETAAVEVLGPAVSAEAERPTTQEIERQVMTFFTYLDSREYVTAHELEGGIYAHYCAMMDLLATHPPRVPGETESLDATLGNVFHFCRALGVKNAQLVAQILKNEPKLTESVLRLFYAWYTAPDSQLVGKPSLETMYGYASFFLETLGGRSYLLRRDSKIRLLTTYYCLRVLDLCRDIGLNPNGVDIRPFIAAASRDMEGHQGLAYREEYTTVLAALSEKYPM